MMKAMIFGMMAVLAMAVSAQALITDNFESDTVGTTPSGAGWSITTTGPGASALVAVDPDPAHNQVLQTLSDGSADLKVQWDYEPVTNGSIGNGPGGTPNYAGGAIQFDLKVNSIGPSDTADIVRVGDNTDNFTGLDHSVSIRGGAFGGPFITANDGNSLTPGNNFGAFPGFTAGTWHTITIVVGPSTGDLNQDGNPIDGGGYSEQIYVDFVLVASGGWAGGPGSAVEFGIDSQTSNPSQDIEIDNIRGGGPGATFDDVAPEPASLGLLGIGSLLMLRRRRQA